MNFQKNNPIQELIVRVLAAECAQYATPIGMRIPMARYEDKFVYYGVIKSHGKLTLGYACCTNEPQAEFTEIIACILYQANRGICPTGNPPAYRELSTLQVAALTGYNSGATVLLDLDQGMVEVYSCDEGSGYIAPAKSDWVFYRQEFCACAYAADIPALFKVNEWPISDTAELIDAD